MGAQVIAQQCSQATYQPGREASRRCSCHMAQTGNPFAIGTGHDASPETDGDEALARRLAASWQAEEVQHEPTAPPSGMTDEQLALLLAEEEMPDPALAGVRAGRA